MKTHPVGVLVPVGGCLLIGIAAATVLQSLLKPPFEAALIGYIALIWFARIACCSPLRAAWLNAGARALGKPAAGPIRWLWLSIIWLFWSLVEVVLGGTVLLAVGYPAYLLVSRGSVTGGLLLGAIGLAVGLILVIVIRTIGSYAAIEVQFSPNGPFTAFLASLGLAMRDLPSAFVLVLLGEVAFALGSLLCGVGSLPTYAVADLALLHRWHSQDTEASPNDTSIEEDDLSSAG